MQKNNKINDLQKMQKQIKKQTARLWAGFFVLFAIILVSGFFMFSSLNFSMIVKALTGDYTKTPGTTLTANDWNNLADDFDLPSGSVVMWYGGAIPTGWQLCDGTGGTPDLRERFVVGAGGIYALNATGGNNTHFHSVDPPNTNTGSVSSSGSGQHSGNNNNHYHSVNIPAFDSDNASSLPPYYALMYICKL